MSDIKECQNLLFSLNKLRMILAGKCEQEIFEKCRYLIDDILIAMQAISETLSISDNEIAGFRKAKELADYFFVNGKGISDFWEAYSFFIENCEKKLMSNQYSLTENIYNSVDEAFYKYMDYLAYTDLQKIAFSMKRALRMLKSENQVFYDKMLYRYNTYNYWGRIDLDKKVFELIDNRAKMLKEHLLDFLWLYGRLCDYRSKKSLLGVIDNWLTFNPCSLEEITDNVFKHYFDPDVIKCDENEVFVDLGAYIGDTVIDFAATYTGYKKIFCYEIVPENFQQLKNNLKNYPNIVFSQKGVSDKNGVMYISDNEPSDSMHKVSDTGKLEVQTVALDDDIKEPVTFIKMDIEGGEQKAIIGCRNLIKATHPKLAISIYHNNEDIWKCARMIDEIDPNYKFYLRYSGGNMYPSEYVLLGI